MNLENDRDLIFNVMEVQSYTEIGDREGADLDDRYSRFMFHASEMMHDDPEQRANSQSIFETLLISAAESAEDATSRLNRMIELGGSIGVSGYRMSRLTGLSQPTISRRIKKTDRLVRKAVADAMRREADRIEKEAEKDE